jgi:hypothetical protein
MRHVLYLSLPLTLWLVSFSGLYGVHGLACSAAWGSQSGPVGLTLGQVVLFAAGGTAILVQMAGLALLARTAPGFARRISLALAAVALVATVWTALPIFLLPICQ